MGVEFKYLVLILLCCVHDVALLSVMFVCIMTWLSVGYIRCLYCELKQLSVYCKKVGIPFRMSGQDKSLQLWLLVSSVEV